MSASEKLKTLGDLVTNDTAPGTGPNDAKLFAALPQIVAVVQVAEEVVGTREAIHAYPERRLSIALTALDEALS